MGKSTISMAIFNSYVKLPEGISDNIPRKWWCFNMRKINTPQRYPGELRGNLAVGGNVVIFYGNKW
jgi:hypothetical protein